MLNATAGSGAPPGAVAQCAAVTTFCGAISVPPQSPSPLMWTKAWAGYWPAAAGDPPTMFERGLAPKAEAGRANSPITRSAAPPRTDLTIESPAADAPEVPRDLRGEARPARRAARVRPPLGLREGRREAARQGQAHSARADRQAAR